MRLAKITTSLTYYVENMPDDELEADTFADESGDRISELVEGVNGVIEGSVKILEWQELPDEVESTHAD